MFEELEISVVVKLELEFNCYQLASTGPVGFVGTHYGPFVAIMADMDALNILQNLKKTYIAAV